MAKAKAGANSRKRYAANVLQAEIDFWSNRLASAGYPVPNSGAVAVFEAFIKRYELIAVMTVGEYPTKEVRAALGQQATAAKNSLE